VLPPLFVFSDLPQRCLVDSPKCPYQAWDAGSSPVTPGEVAS
jgi:hypothetical protein